MNTDTIFLELQAQIKFLDARFDPLKSNYPENGIKKAINSFLNIIDGDFQLRNTYYSPILNFSKKQFAEVDFYLVGQNLEYCVAAIIHAFKLEHFVYKNCDNAKSYRTLKDHLQILIELQKGGSVSYTSQKNITTHLRGYRNAIVHESSCPSNSNVRREYIRGTLGSLILIVYYIENSSLSNNTKSLEGVDFPKASNDSVQSILDSFF